MSDPGNEVYTARDNKVAGEELLWRCLNMVWLRGLQDLQPIAIPTNIRPDRDPVLLALAREFCLKGDEAHRVNWKLPNCTNRIYRPTKGQIRHRGGIQAVMDQIRRGDLGIEEQLRPWTGGFWRGLIMSGAVRPQSGRTSRRYQIWASSHVELIRDLEEAKIGMHLEQETGKSGCRRLTRCSSILLPVEDEADVIAGLFAGATLTEDIEGQTWLTLPASDDVVNLLKKWTIVHRPWAPFRNRERIVVSPFYGMLFRDRMPAHSSKRIQSISKPALGEIMPLMYWEAYFAREKKRILPFAGALPYGISPRTFRRRKYQREELHKLAVKHGITSLAAPLRQVMTAWHERVGAERNHGKNSAAQLAPLPV